MLVRRTYLATISLLLTAILSVPVGAESLETAPCESWQPECFEIEGLPPQAPRTGIVITVDTSRNMLYLFRDGQLVKKSRAATGSNKMLKHGLRVWLFRTPHGRHLVQDKIVNPVWFKPDWAYVEEGKSIPRAGSPKRQIRGKLGKYALDLGEGILIHGTDEPSSIGKKASHGCVRLPAGMMELVFREADRGTEVHIF